MEVERNWNVIYVKILTTTNYNHVIHGTITIQLKVEFPTFNMLSFTFAFCLIMSEEDLT